MNPNLQHYANYPSAFQCIKTRSQKIYGVILLSKNNNVLLVQGRKTMKWSFPKGHIKAFESRSECAFRECYEETGIAVDDLEPKHPRLLDTGYYYIYTDVEETMPNIQDSLEIVKVDWVPVNRIKYLRNNKDIRYFLDNYETILNNEMPHQ